MLLSNRHFLPQKVLSLHVFLYLYINISFSSELFPIFSPDISSSQLCREMLFFKFLRLIFNNNLLLYYLFISKTLTLVLDSEVVLICSFFLLLLHYCNSAPTECHQKSIYQLHLVQHTIAGFPNRNNKKSHSIPFYQTFIVSQIATKIGFVELYVAFPFLTFTTICFFFSFNQPQHILNKQNPNFCSPPTAY